MPAFIDPAEWKVAEEYFKRKPLDSQMVGKLQRASSIHHPIGEPETKYSYLRFGQSILKLFPGKNKPGAAIAGSGASARVKYLYTRNGKRYTVKIDNDKSAFRNPKFMDLETKISLDLGFFKTRGYRIKHSRESEKRKGIYYSRYAVMEDLGEQLKTYLNSHHFTLSDKTRLDMAFQACFKVYQLHKGWLSKSGKPISHLDIKPANFYYDEKTKKLSLGDYGFSEYGPLTIHPGGIKGTPNYLPYRRGSHPNFKNWRNGALDIFALKRTCFCPLKRQTYVLYAYQEKDLPPMILNQEILDAHHLSSYFETSNNYEPKYGTLFLSSICLLASVNQSVLITKIKSSEPLQKAIIVLHFANCLDESHLSALFKKPAYAHFLAEHINKLNTLPLSAIENITPPEIPAHKEDDTLSKMSCARV